MTSFSQFMNQIDFPVLARAVEKVTTDDVRALLGRERLLADDAIKIFSPVAQEFMEDIAARAAALTERRFGKTIQLYAPLYLSNECSNACVYCGFSADTNIARISLTTEQALADADLLYEEGFRHILLLTGESPGHYGVEEIRRVARALSEKFASVSIEVFPMSTQDYRKLEGVGVDSLTLYQETYDPEHYAALHPRGPKSNYRKRIEAIEQGGMAGFRSLGIGALLGLSDWRMEAILLAWHARYLTKRFWKSRIAVSFPRVNSAEGAFDPPFPVSDTHMVQMITGMRLLLPDADLVLSTREPAALRDNMVGLGITRMSAGSRTNPGGYVTKPDSKMQFSVADHRTPSEVAAMIEAKGYEPVWKDFDHAFQQDVQ
jgi:2-iminoacetate synthase